MGNASKHVQYLAAKTGNLDAAVSMVMDLINPETITRLTNVIADKQPLLIPVHAEEAVSINRIPLAYAMILAKRCDLPVELNIVQAAKVNRTGSNGFTRLAFPPPFKGIPSQSVQYAIILDDIVFKCYRQTNIKSIL